MAQHSRRSADAPTRRGVLASALTVGAGWAVGAGPAVAAPETPAPMPRRALGRTGVEVSVFGLGCFYLGGAASDAEGAEVLQRAVELGCTYVDTAPSYYAGVSERRVGRGLVGRRHQVFLATKTLLRAPKEARRELEASLTRMGTDHVDLIQVHCVRDAKDCALVLSDAGPLPELVRAKEKGLTRFIGVTGHEDPAVMKTCIEGYPWDTVLMPFNPTDPHWKSFLEGALPTAIARGVGRIGMKVFGGGRLVQGEGGLPPEDCLRFAFGLDLATAIVGCATKAQVETAARVAAEARPLTEERRRELIAQAARFSGKGEKGVEWYKRA